MSKTKIVCPKCGAEFAIPETTHVAVGVVIGADSNLGTIHPTVVGQSKPNRKDMKAEAKIEALRKAGVNVDNLFSMKGATGQEIVARLTNGQLTVVPDDDPIFASILGGGTVRNPQLFRRWVMAQVFHMLADGNFLQALQNKGYAYQWKMIVEELLAQSKMETRGDAENFAQRNLYFNKERVYLIAMDYIEKLRDHIRVMPKKRCKRVPYIRLKGQNIFVEDVPAKVTQPLLNLALKIKASKNATELYVNTVSFYALVKKTWVSYTIPMANEFKDAYKGAGAYFTMRNLILFHSAKFRSDAGRFLSQSASLTKLDEKANLYSDEGWRLFGVMKQLIKDNGININRKIAEWRK
jgi:hypothetical protein